MPKQRLQPQGGGTADTLKAQTALKDAQIKDGLGNDLLPVPDSPASKYWFAASHFGGMSAHFDRISIKSQIAWSVGGGLRFMKQ